MRGSVKMWGVVLAGLLAVGCGGSDTSGTGTPACTWTTLAQYALDVAPTGSVQKGAQGVATVGGRTAWNQTATTGALLFVPTGLASGDDVFAFQADVYWPGTTGLNHQALIDSFVSTTGSGIYFQTLGVVNGLLETAPGVLTDKWFYWNGSAYTEMTATQVNYPTTAWHAFRIEGQRSTCRFRALLDGQQVGSWTNPACNLSGGYVALHSGGEIAWSNLVVQSGSASACVP